MTKNLRRVDPTEHEIQAAIVEWANNTSAHYWDEKIGDFLFSIPNGGSRNIFEAINLKKQGVKRGVCDLFLAVPWGEKHGLWIECKTIKGKLSQSQKIWIERMNNLDYEAIVIRGVDEGIQAIKYYLGMR